MLDCGNRAEDYLGANGHMVVNWEHSSMVERMAVNHDVVGSSPTVPAIGVEGIGST